MTLLIRYPVLFSQAEKQYEAFPTIYETQEEIFLG